jgi:hypothetical protein
MDLEDYHSLVLKKWKLDSGGYAVRLETVSFKKRIKLSMHRVVMGEIPLGYEVDHINGNKVDNRKSNLRICTKMQNYRNRGKTKANTSGFKGVSWHKRIKKWVVQIHIDGKNKSLGYFIDPYEGYLAYCEAAIKHHGEFANLGEIPRMPS